MKTRGLLVVAMLCTTSVGILSGAPAGNIIQLIHRLSLTSEQKSIPRDFFVDLGSHHGMAVGTRLEVTRKIVSENTQSGLPQDFISVPLGEARVLFVGDMVSIAREENLRPASELTVVRYPVFMLGDDVVVRNAELQPVKVSD
jgi:hypothetical protein